MEYQTIINLLDTTSDNVTRFIAKKCMEDHDQSGGSYNINKQIRFKTSMLRSYWCDYSDACIVVKGIIINEGRNNRDIKNRYLAFKINAPFINSISKINIVLTDNEKI